MVRSKGGLVPPLLHLCSRSAGGSPSRSVRPTDLKPSVGWPIL